MRSLSQEEQAFLAWAFIEWTLCPRKVEGATCEGLMAEWSELTGQEFAPDFIKFCIGIHDVQ